MLQYGNWGSVVPWNVGGAVSGVDLGCGALAGDEGEGKGMVVLWWHGTMQPLLESERDYCLLGNVSLSDHAEM